MNDCPNCEYHKQRAQRWREEAYRQAGHPLPEREWWVGLTDEEILQAYGWKLASGAPNWLLEEAKQELLGALRKVEAKLKEKNG
jgi:hypothetical protein